jgi:hypothetical protein
MHKRVCARTRFELFKRVQRAGHKGGTSSASSSSKVQSRAPRSSHVVNAAAQVTVPEQSSVGGPGVSPQTWPLPHCGVAMNAVTPVDRVVCS